MVAGLRHVHLWIARTGVEGDASSANIVQRDGQVEVVGLVELVFHGKPERISTGEHER